jgi:hypothetical protein
VRGVDSQGVAMMPLCAAHRSEAHRPVQVAGDPENADYAHRARDAIPLPGGLSRALRDMARSCGAPWLLGPQA